MEGFKVEHQSVHILKVAKAWAVDLVLYRQSHTHFVDIALARENFLDIFRFLIDFESNLSVSFLVRRI